MPAVRAPKMRKQDWRTPPGLVRSLQAMLLPPGQVFGLDAAATEANAVVIPFYPKEQDGLRQVWARYTWVNPEYADIGPWVRKALQSVSDGDSEIVVMLLPARTGTSWFELAYRSALLAHVIFLRHRIAFHDDSGTPIRGNNEDSLVLVIKRSIGATTFCVEDVRDLV